jgi:two-component system, cell cycle response regulator
MNSVTRRRTDSNIDSDIDICVLVADDDPDYRTYLAALARRNGLEVETAADGAEALDRLKSGDFDLLLADYEMPHLDGVTLIAAVRSLERISGLYAVMLTGHDDVAVKIEALTAGYDDFLSKRSTEVELLAKVAAARRMLSRQRALDIAAREWRDLATRDELTGVFSRRFFFDEAARHLGAGRTMGIILIDLDDFKTINDTWGHLTGDRILRDIGALFLRQTRHGDVIARFGGDEFVLLACEASLDDTRAIAQRVVDAIASLRWDAGENIIQVRATTGVGHSLLLPGANADVILDAADRDLYANKWLRKQPNATAEELYQYRRDHQSEVVRLPDVPIVRLRGEGESRG